MISFAFLDPIIEALPLLLKGAALTLQISFLGILLGLSLGTLLGLFNCNKLKIPVLNKFITSYVIVFRGTPIFVQLLIVYFALPQALGIDFSPFFAGVFTLGLNSSAYISEIVRGGINSIAVGQWDACFSLGYGKAKALRYIILPQTFKNVLPSITNELATLIKESSILIYIGVPELLKVSKDVVARELNPIEIYLTAAVLYLIMTSAVAFLAKVWERRLA